MVYMLNIVEEVWICVCVFHPSSTLNCHRVMSLTSKEVLNIPTSHSEGLWPMILTYKWCRVISVEYVDHWAVQGARSSAGMVLTSDLVSLEYPGCFTRRARTVMLIPAFPCMEYFEKNIVFYSLALLFVLCLLLACHKVRGSWWTFWKVCSVKRRQLLKKINEI